MNRYDDFVVAVLGVTGAGKSSFIQLIVRDDRVPVADSLSSITTQIESYQTILPGGRKITLIDTPPLDEPYGISDVDILRELKTFLLRNHLKLSGLIYLQRITDRRFSVSTTQEVVHLWKSLLGDDLSNLVLATTFWVGQYAGSAESARIKEKDIEESLWAPFIKQGARMFRLDPDRESALYLIDQLDLKRSTKLEDRSHPEVRSPSKRESQPSAYEPLDPGQIRLIDLQDGEGKGPIAVELLVMPFDEKVEYEALSYSVGKLEKTAILSLSHHGRREQLRVTPNLELILRYLRYPDKNRRLWVDAISINQEDLEERGCEVRRLGKIFAEAQNVCIWLGDSADDSDLAMDFIPQVLDFGTFDSLVLDDSKKRYWLALANLMAREWFTRRWVVQEMALARKATVYCGPQIIPWTDMAKAAALFGTRREDIVRQLSPQEAFMFGDVQTPGATSLMDLSTRVFRRDQSGKIFQRRLGLEALLAILPLFDVTVPSDAIYSIIDIAHDTYNTNSIPVNYGLDPAILFSEVIDFIIRKSRSMDIICRPWAPFCPNLPSYVSTISDYAFERRQDGQYYRQNADSLTGFPGRSFYRAAANFLPSHEMVTSSGCTAIECKGRPLGHLIDVGVYSVNGNVPRQWRALAGWLDRSQPVPEKFWRTLVADRDPHGDEPPSWYGNAAKYAFTRGRADTDISELLKTSKSSNERQFLRRVQATVWNRTFFTMRDREDNVTFGLGPADTKSSDLVIIVFGCSVPVILRKRKILEFKLVGECFVHGYMDGEGVRSPGLNKDETYWIV